MVVTARDQGSPPLSASMEITITVLDQNDNTPQFQPRTYSRTVLENATLGQNILHTKAFDTDLGLNGEIRYTIVSGDRTADFRLCGEPELRLLQPEQEGSVSEGDGGGRQAEWDYVESLGKNLRSCYS